MQEPVHCTNNTLATVPMFCRPECENVINAIYFYSFVVGTFILFLGYFDLGLPTL